ncbi:hypothetical protein EVJ58_g6722 [Rhodofomes roseus]|uniref:HMG box domain-containing protein n=1 Tax=Rhodofomes roseus TaxID=34475 RepID=A0A4Y9Y6V6_9APHY|nr:hypothetical protein EVJ58_g6722 [Rhodofomes roseus]
MTPITFSNDPTTYELPSEGGGVSEMSIYSPPASPALGPMRMSHAKKRDPSYIPRPPNAFILFRSSFIRAEHIPGKIEGNHSALSKIIGKYWKALPREEREVWEAKAIVAQAEHRKKYPDWRFRPSANALAKVKDGPKRRVRKGRGEAEKEVRSREKRCAKIADLLVAGKTGPALEAAVKEYDCTADGHTTAKKVKREVAAAAAPKEEAKDGGLPGGDTAQVAGPLQLDAAPDDRPGRMPGTAMRSMTPDAAYDARFKVPLTSMFKRSSSAPASHFRNNSGQTDELGRAVTANGHTMPTTPPMVYASPTPSDIASPALEHEATRVGPVMYPSNDGMHKTVPDGTAATQQSVPNFYGAGEFIPFGDSPQWHAASASSPNVTECWSPPLLSFTPDIEGSMSPLQPPSPVAFNISSPRVGSNAFDLPMFSKFDGDPHASFHSSYSSLKGWAGDAFMRGDQPLSLMAPPYVFPQSAGAGLIMKDAFEAATCVDWRGFVGASMVQDFAMYPPNNTRDLEGGQYHPEALQNIGCHPSNSPYVF